MQIRLQSIWIPYILRRLDIFILADINFVELEQKHYLLGGS